MYPQESLALGTILYHEVPWYAGRSHFGTFLTAHGAMSLVNREGRRKYLLANRVTVEDIYMKLR